MHVFTMSHPLWVRGLKLDFGRSLARLTLVAPFMGAWIEIPIQYRPDHICIVAPFMGAWIEIVRPYRFLKLEVSHPLWVRGLKLLRRK